MPGSWPRRSLGPLLALLGALPNYPPLALVSAVALVLAVAAQILAISRVVFGDLANEWASSLRLDRLRDLFASETASL